MLFLEHVYKSNEQDCTTIRICGYSENKFTSLSPRSVSVYNNIYERSISLWDSTYIRNVNKNTRENTRRRSHTDAHTHIHTYNNTQYNIVPPCADLGDWHAHARKFTPPATPGLHLAAIRAYKKPFRRTPTRMDSIDGTGPPNAPPR